MSSDNEVVDREIIHTQAESDRNARIKDTMREHSVLDLTNSWYDILVSQPLLWSPSQYIFIVPLALINYIENGCIVKTSG